MPISPTDLHDAHAAAQRLVRDLRGVERLESVFAEAHGLAGALAELEAAAKAARTARDQAAAERDALTARVTQLREELADLEPRAARATEALATAEARLAEMRARLG